MASACSDNIADPYPCPPTTSSTQRDDSIDSMGTPFSGSNSIVIIGAGSIGLWTAFYLARTPSLENSDGSKLVVLEAQESTFGAASGTNTGCVHYGFSDAKRIELGKYSFALWRDLAGQDEFESSVGLRFGSIFGLSESEGESLDLLPDWIRTADTWRTETDFLGTNNASV